MDGLTAVFLLVVVLVVGFVIAKWKYNWPA